MPKSLLGLPLLLAVAVTCACTVSVAGPDTPSTSPKPSASASPKAIASKVSATNLSGAWIYGAKDEPPAGAVAPDCPQVAHPFNLAQSGEEVTGSWSCGLCTVEMVGKITGKNVAGKVTLTMTGTNAGAYDLKYVAATQHLVGTVDGKPYWMAPLAEDAQERFNARQAAAGAKKVSCPSD